MTKRLSGVRYAEVDRESSTSRTRVVLDLDESVGKSVRPSAIQTSLPFFDELLFKLVFHAQVEMGIACEIEETVDEHHIIEDVGMALGQAIYDSIGDPSNIKRFSSHHTPKDDALVLVAMDIGGASHLSFECEFKREQIGEMATESVREFFKCLTQEAGMSLHIHKISGVNDRHVIEAMFKGVGMAIYQATRKSERGNSTSKRSKGR